MKIIYVLPAFAILLLLQQISIKDNVIGEHKEATTKPDKASTYAGYETYHMEICNG